jgi:hypothetical protein
VKPGAVSLSEKSTELTLVPMGNMHHNKIIQTTLALAVLGLLVDRFAFADGPTPVAPRVIPYEGILELDGESVGGTRRFAFEIWDSPGAGGTKLWPIDATPDGLLESVPVTNGRFAVQLGGEGMDALPDAVFSAPATYLTVSVDGVELSNHQRLVNPWLAANGPVTINGPVMINGTLTVVGATSTASLTVSTDISAGRDINAVRNTNVGGALTAASLNAGTVVATNDATVGRDLSITRNTIIGGDLSAPNNVPGPAVQNGYSELSGGNDQDCSNGQFQVGHQISASGFRIACSEL